MVMNVMLTKMQFRGDHPPMTGAERQAAFRRRNPGYYQRLHAQRRAAVKERLAQLNAAEQTPAQVILTLPDPTVRLALPAPVIDPMLLDLNALAEKFSSVPHPIARSAEPADRSLAA